MTEPTKAGIVIDPWKRPIFERHLTQAGYTFETPRELHKDALLIRIDTQNVEALGEVLKAAAREAARTGKPA